MTRDEIEAELARVTTPIKTVSWYVPHEQAEGMMQSARDSGEDESYITSPEGWHVWITANEDGRAFCKRIHISPSSCVARVCDKEAIWKEVAYLTEKRKIELRRDIAVQRLMKSRHDGGAV